MIDIITYEIILIPKKGAGLTKNRKDKFKTYFNKYKVMINDSDALVFKKESNIIIITNTIVKINIKELKSVFESIKYILDTFNYKDANIDYECTLRLQSSSDIEDSKKLDNQIRMFEKIIKSTEMNFPILPTKYEFITKHQEKVIGVSISITTKGLQFEVSNNIKSINEIDKSMKLMNDFSKEYLVPNIEKILSNNLENDV